jgi:non-specific serine/threonine protein kinase
MYEQAIKLDPNFALAHAGVGNICGLIFELREQSQKWIERGLTACDRALALDDQAPEVLVARARVFYAQKRYDEAVRYAQRAIDRKSDCEGAYNILGRALFSSDRSQEAAAIVERALEANGDDYNTYIRTPTPSCSSDGGRKPSVWTFASSTRSSGSSSWSPMTSGPGSCCQTGTPA